MRKILYFWYLLLENRITINWVFIYYPETTLPSNGSDMKESLLKEIEIFLYNTIQYGSFIDFLIQKQETESD